MKRNFIFEKTSFIKKFKMFTLYFPTFLCRLFEEKKKKSCLYTKKKNIRSIEIYEEKKINSIISREKKTHEKKYLLTSLNYFGFSFQP